MLQLLAIIKDCLVYPIKVGNLVIIVVATAIGTLLLSALHASNESFGSGWSMLVFFMGFVAFFPYINALFVHGIRLISASSEGYREPPAMSGTAFWDGAFSKQLLIFFILSELAAMLIGTGHDYSALLISLFVCCFLPASLALYSLYSRFFISINPISLIQVILTIGKPYLLCTTLLFSIACLGQSMALDGPLELSLKFFTAVYLLFVFFRLLGLSLYWRHSTLFTKADFKAEQNKIRQVSQANEKFNKLLTQTHDLVRAGDLEGAEKLIVPVVSINTWSRFELAFSTISQWDKKHIGLTLISGYLPVAIKQQQFMRSLELAQWALKHQADFCLGSNEEVEQLAIHAVINEHYKTVISLIGNCRDVTPVLLDTRLNLQDKLDSNTAR